MESLQKGIETTRLHIEALERMAPVFEAYEGKQVNKRLETKLREALDPFTVVFNREYSSAIVKVWGNGLDYNSMLSVYLLNPHDTMTRENVELIPRILGNQRHQLAQFERELKALPAMKRDLAKIEKSAAAFIEKYGTRGDYDTAISYTARNMLNENSKHVKL
jgi:hypothetical protein